MQIFLLWELLDRRGGTGALGSGCCWYLHLGAAGWRIPLARSGSGVCGWIEDSSHIDIQPVRSAIETEYGKAETLNLKRKREPEEPRSRTSVILIFYNIQQSTLVCTVRGAQVAGATWLSYEARIKMCE